MKNIFKLCRSLVYVHTCRCCLQVWHSKGAEQRKKRSNSVMYKFEWHNFYQVSQVYCKTSVHNEIRAAAACLVEARISEIGTRLTWTQNTYPSRLGSASLVVTYCASVIILRRCHFSRRQQRSDKTRWLSNTYSFSRSIESTPSQGSFFERSFK